MLGFNLTQRHNAGSITLYVNGKQFGITHEHPSYQEIKDLLYEYTYETDATEKTLIEDEILELCDVRNNISKKTQGKVTVDGNGVYYNGQLLHNTFTVRLMDTIRQGFPIEGMIKFLENLMENPSYTSINELGDFLAHKGLPITDDGCFLGYKKVREDYLDYYSRTFDNTPNSGKPVQIPRQMVDDNRSNTCSVGLHVGALEYAANQYYPNEGRVVVVKVNPADCVSVPLDHSAQKLRVWKYEVVADYTGPLPDSVYNSEALDLSDPENDDYIPDYVTPEPAALAKGVQDNVYVVNAGW